MINYKFHFNFNENLNIKDISFQINNNYGKLCFENLFTNLDDDSKQFLNKLFTYAKNINSGYIYNIVLFYYLVTSI